MAVKREIKVGAFMIVGLIVAGFITFLVGDERRIFERHYDLRASFTDVVGLKPGSPVRMGGIDVGSVKSVTFGKDPADKRLHVVFSVTGDAHARIHEDSLVTISNKGLLGDKMLEVTQGSDALAIIPDGGEMKSEQPDDLSKYLKRADDLLDLAQDTLKNLRTVTATAADKDVQEDLKSSIASIRAILGDAASKNGFVHRLLTDPVMAEHLDAVFVEAKNAGQSFDKVAIEMRSLLHQVKAGPGLAHTLLYSKEGDKTLAALTKTAEELQATMAEIRTGKGAIHQLVYGEGGEQITANVAKMTEDLKDIVAQIKAGKGTIGAMVVDPSIYEDVKSILGNIDRNQVLRALVRYTIKQDEEPPSPAMQPAPSSTSDPPKVVPGPKGTPQ